MRKASVTVAVCATLLCAGTVLAIPMAQQECDSARITAWKTFNSCVDDVAAKDAKGVIFDEFKAFWKCRHTYFHKWAGLQARRSLLGSTCTGVRFTDNGDQTVTDALTGLVWEQKDNLDSTFNFGDPHDANNAYTWSLGPPYAEDGTAFTSFLTDPTVGLNVTAFAGSSGWRLPTLTELQTILDDFTCGQDGGSPTCRCTPPCIGFDKFNLNELSYWCATTLPGQGAAWVVDFVYGYVSTNATVMGDVQAVRAVRGGL